VGDVPPRERLLEEIRQLGAAMHRAMAPTCTKDWVDVDLTMSQLKILFVLHGGVLPNGDRGLRVGEVAHSLGVTLPTVTAVMDKLVERGLVRRAEDPRDRRQHLCRLTPAGQGLIDRLIDSHRAYHERLHEFLTDKELAIILQGMRLLIGAVERFGVGAADDALNVPRSAFNGAAARR